MNHLYWLTHPLDTICYMETTTRSTRYTVISPRSIHYNVHILFFSSCFDVFIHSISCSSSLISPFLLILHLLVVCYIIIIIIIIIYPVTRVESKGLPLVQQTEYQHGVSCLDAMFSAYDTLSYLTMRH